MNVWLSGLLVLVFSATAFAQVEEEVGHKHAVVEVDMASQTNNQPAVLMFEGQELLHVAGVFSLTADVRVSTISRNLKRMAKSPLVNTDNFEIDDNDAVGVSLIRVKDSGDMLCTVWDSDAKLNDMPRIQLAEQWHEILSTAIDDYRRARTMEAILRSSLFAALATIIFLVIWLVIHKVFSKEMAYIEKTFAGKKTLKLLDGDTVVSIHNNTAKIIRTLIMLTIFIVYLNIVLGLFPWTYNLSARLFHLISTPVITFARAFVNNLPNLFAIGVIVVITHFVLKSLKHIFQQIGEGKVRIRGFYTDWADTTYSLIRIVVIVFAAVVAWPNIPGSDTTAFKGISIFMGILVSLGSSSAMGNIFGGLMLTYMRAFTPGDFVEINNLRGTVMQSRTFSTRLKTPTNEIISIPNQAVSANPIINYSRMTKSIGVNMGTSVTIGYDVPWRKVHALLLKSAEGVEDVLEDPSPTILQLSLDDFYVKYKLVISTKNPAKKFRILSDLHQNIQDNFAKAGVEIMSPHYQDNRNGGESTIPDMNDISI